MTTVNLNLSVQDPERFSPVLEDAKRAGMMIGRSFEDLGVASGSIDLDRLPLLRRIEGLTIENDRAVGLPRSPGR